MTLNTTFNATGTTVRTSGSGWNAQVIPMNGVYGSVLTHRNTGFVN